MSGAKTSNKIGQEYGVLPVQAGLAVMAPGPNASCLYLEHKVCPCLARGFFAYLVVVIDWYLRRMFSWRVSNSMKSISFAAVRKVIGLNFFRDGRHINLENNYLSLLSGIILTILAISGLY
jgi:hypothetical protein